MNFVRCPDEQYKVGKKFQFWNIENQNCYEYRILSVKHPTKKFHGKIITEKDIIRLKVYVDIWINTIPAMDYESYQCLHLKCDDETLQSYTEKLYNESSLTRYCTTCGQEWDFVKYEYDIVKKDYWWRCDECHQIDESMPGYKTAFGIEQEDSREIASEYYKKNNTKFCHPFEYVSVHTLIEPSFEKSPKKYKRNDIQQIIEKRRWEKMKKKKLKKKEYCPICLLQVKNSERVCKRSLSHIVCMDCIVYYKEKFGDKCPICNLGNE